MNTGGGFFSKIKENYSTKFANLSLTTEKDGNSEDDTLIHNAFVKYFDSKGEPYPDWLGVKAKDYQTTQGQNQAHPYREQLQTRQSYSNSQYQPVRHNNLFNNSYQQRMQQQAQQQQAQQQQQSPRTPQLSASSKDSAPTYTRSSSRLAEMYNKSKQTDVPGQVYTNRYQRH
ncbi:unnamed protein product [Candida verbasci]|uniref:Mso1 N-terminal domain-containing protein n=1 Tax=Candida verbasci TaxID=1227364 RepID=A0A9W4XKF3_9ASCO|nr:unnamed protein product [Candida verbasci]